MKRSLIEMSIVLTLISPSAFAVESCETVFGESAVRTLEMTGPSLLSQEKYQELLNSVDELLGSLVAPDVLKISVTEPGMGGLYSRNDNHISVPSKFLKYKSNKGSHPKFATAILSHEYGHAILSKNIGTFSPLWKAYNTEQAGIAERSREASQELMASFDALHNATTPAEKSAAEARKGRAFTNMRTVGERLSNLLSMRDIMTAYDEMFADSVAVVRFQEPRIIFNALSGDALVASSVGWYKDPASKFAVRFSEKDLLRINIENRQFDKSWGSANLKQWQKDIAGTIANKDLHPYLLLAPARAAVWDVIKYKVGNPQQQKQILEKLLEVIGKHFEANFQNIEAAKTVNPLEFNQSLIREIDKMFGN